MIRDDSSYLCLNVFAICTLVDTYKVLRKKQNLGTGQRAPYLGKA